MSNRSTIDIRHHAAPTAAIALRILLVVAPFASVAEAQFNGGLFAAVDGEHSADAADEVAETPGIRTMRSRLVRVNAEQLEAAREAREVNATLALNLFDEVLLSAVVERAAPTASGIGYALSGRINLAILSGRIVDGDFGAMTLLVYDEDEGTMVTGTVNASIGTFTIRPIGDGMHSIREVDTSGLPQFEEPLSPPPATEDPGMGSRQPPPTSPIAGAEGADDFSEIDVAVFYTPAARDGAATLKGRLGITALVDEMFENANAAYQMSGAMLRVRRVLLQEVTYMESGSQTDLERLTYKSDGFMDEIHGLRDEYSADLVHLISGAGVSCGRAWTDLHESRGFGLTRYDCEVGDYTFAHELGHNMGLNHDRYAVKCRGRVFGLRPGTCNNDIDNHPYAHSYGYVNQQAFSSNATRDQAWMTIMAYDWQCRDAGYLIFRTGRYCHRQRRFSNPNLDLSGDALGISGTADSQEVTGPSDAVRTLNLTRHNRRQTS